MAERFRGEFVDRAGMIYRGPKPGRDVRKNPIGESKLECGKKLFKDHPFFCRTLSEYSFSRPAISQDR